MRTVFDTTRALSSSDRSLHLTHLCVGPYNTQLDQHGKAKSILSGPDSSYVEFQDIFGFNIQVLPLSLKVDKSFPPPLDGTTLRT